MPSDEMPERIWLIPDAGNDGETLWCNDPAPGAGMDPDDAVEYLRRDLCASGQQVRALTDDTIRAYAKEHRIYIREHGLRPDIKNGGWIHPFTLTISSDELRAMFAALTPAPQPEGEAGCLHGYCDAENCPACSQDQEVAQPEGQVRALEVDDLAQIIRVVDGNNTLGAGELAEAILEAMPDPKIVTALEAYGREKVREGMQRAFELYPQGIAAILAEMEKEASQ